MANTFGTDILIQARTPMKAANFYVKELGFEIHCIGRQVLCLVHDDVRQARRPLDQIGCLVDQHGVGRAPAGRAGTAGRAGPGDGRLLSVVKNAAGRPPQQFGI